jgi:hypothetical protein
VDDFYTLETGSAHGADQLCFPRECDATTDMVCPYNLLLY